MAIDPAPVRDKSSDQIDAGTLRLTTWLQTVGVLTASGGALDTVVWGHFSSGQQVALIIAGIAFMALSQVADVLARAWTTAASTAAGAAGVPEGTAFPMEASKRVTVAMPGQDEYQAKAIARKLGAGGIVCYLTTPIGDVNGHRNAWVQEDLLTAPKD